MEAAAIAEALRRPRQPDDGQRLVESRAILRGAHAKAVELAWDRPAPDAEFQTSARQHVGGGGLLGGGQRMLQRQQRHGGADADPPRALGDDGDHHERVGEQRERAAEVQLGQPRDVDAELFGKRDELEHLRVALGVALALGLRRLKEHPESHRERVPQSTAAGARGIASHCSGSWPYIIVAPARSRSVRSVASESRMTAASQRIFGSTSRSMFSRV